MIEDEYEKLVTKLKKSISMYVDEEYEELLDRIKFDLYQEFINPETATYGVKYVDDKPLYEGELSERQALQDELGRLCMLQNKFVDNEDYEKAEIMKKKIINLQKKIDKL